MSNARLVAARLRLRVLPPLLLLYGFAVLTTMAGMEMLGWLSVLVVVLFMVVERKSLWFTRPVLLAGDFALLGILTAIILSAVIAAPATADRVFIIGNARFVLLYLGLRIALESLTLDQIERGLRWLAVVVGIIALYAIFQHFFGIDLIRGDRRPITQVFAGGTTVFRSQGMWGHPVTFGHSMALTFCMCVAVLASLERTAVRLKFLFATVSGLCAVALIFSYTRGAWLGVGAALIVMSFYIGRKVALVVVLAVLILAGGLAVLSSQLRDRLESITSLTTQSNAERIDVWKANLEMFREHPWLGVGYGENENLITEYYTKIGVQQTFGGHAHNNYLQFLSGTGFIGFLAYTLFSLIFLWMSHRLLRSLPREETWMRAIALGALGAQVALHVGGLTECNFKDAEVNHQYMLILALLMVVWRANRNRVSTASVLRV